MTDLNQIIGRLAIFSDGPELVMTREQFAEHIEAARAEGMREAARIAARHANGSAEWARHAAAIETAILSAIGDSQ